MRFIGVDISVRDTGYAVLDENGELLFTGSIQSSTKMKDITRFSNGARRLLNSIKPVTGDIVLLEDYAYGASGQITRIAEYTGLIKHALGNCVGEEMILRCAPGTLKKFVFGKGTASKSLVIKTVYKKWGFDTNNDNIADALVLSKLCHAFWTRSNLAKYEEEVVKAVEKTNGVKINEFKEKYEAEKAGQVKRPGWVGSGGFADEAAEKAPKARAIYKKAKNKKIFKRKTKKD